jgi:hypothetical protein
VLAAAVFLLQWQYVGLHALLDGVKVWFMNISWSCHVGHLFTLISFDACSQLGIP